MDRQQLEQQLAALPLFQYEFITPEELTFSERIRHVCESECPMYNTTWACPPAVGTVEECKTRCLSFPHALMMTSVAEVQDTANMAETLATRGPHEALTHQVEQLLRDCGATETYVLSTETVRREWQDAVARCLRLKEFRWDGKNFLPIEPE